MSGHITSDQMRELLVQDQERELGDDVQLLITGNLAVKTPEEYFSRLIHRVWLSVGRPNQLAKTEVQYRERFPKPDPWGTHVHRHHTLYLPVEPKVTLPSLCAGFTIAYGGDDGTLEPWDQDQERPQWHEPHWMWCQPGPWFFNWEPQKVRSEGCAPKEWPLSVHEGVHVWGLTGPYPYVTDCPRSVLRGRREDCAYLGLVDPGPGLDWAGDDFADPRCGGGSRGE